MPRLFPEVLIRVGRGALPAQCKLCVQFSPTLSPRNNNLHVASAPKPGQMYVPIYTRVRHAIGTPHILPASSLLNEPHHSWTKRMLPLACPCGLANASLTILPSASLTSTLIFREDTFGSVVRRHSRNLGHNIPKPALTICTFVHTIVHRGLRMG